MIFKPNESKVIRRLKVILTYLLVLCAIPFLILFFGIMGLIKETDIFEFNQLKDVWNCAGSIDKRSKIG